MRKTIPFLGGVLLLSVLIPIAAQQPGVPVTNKQADAVIGPPGQKRVATEAGSNKVVPRTGTLPPDTVEPLPPKTIRVRIRYTKVRGYLELGGGAFTNVSLPTSCNAFEVRTTTIGAFGNSKRIGSVVQQNDQMKEDTSAGLYSCWYTVGDLPLGFPITVIGKVIEQPRFLTERWLGGPLSQPPPGAQRTVVGNRTVILTAAQPSAVVDLEMVYHRASSSSR